MNWVGCIAACSAFFGAVSAVGLYSENPTAASWAAGYALWAICTVVVSQYSEDHGR